MEKRSFPQMVLEKIYNINKQTKKEPQFVSNWANIDHGFKCNMQNCKTFRRKVRIKYSGSRARQSVLSLGIVRKTKKW